MFCTAQPATVALFNDQGGDFAGTVPDDCLDYLPRSESKVIGPRAPCDHRLVNVTASRRVAAASDGRWFISTDVRFGSKADIAALPINVRFTPGHQFHASGCPLCVISGHLRSAAKLDVIRSPRRRGRVVMALA